MKHFAYHVIANRSCSTYILLRINIVVPGYDDNNPIAQEDITFYNQLRIIHENYILFNITINPVDMCVVLPFYIIERKALRKHR